MECTCSRCHQTLQEGGSFCPNCGLPQLTYSATDALLENVQPGRWEDAVREAGSIEWQPALRSVLLLAIPAGLVGALLGVPGLLVMAILGAWAVSRYVRSQRPAWITMITGARIGLAFGLIAGWLAFAVAGGSLYLNRYAFHNGDQMDAQWTQLVDYQAQTTQKLFDSMGISTAEIQSQQAQSRARMLSPEGHAGMVTADLALSSFLFVIFAITGGALSARFQAKRRRSQL